MHCVVLAYLIDDLPWRDVHRVPVRLPPPAPPVPRPDQALKPAQEEQAAWGVHVHAILYVHIGTVPAEPARGSGSCEEAMRKLW
jgi:hypothetical protein